MKRLAILIPLLVTTLVLAQPTVILVPLPFHTNAYWWWTNSPNTNTINGQLTTNQIAEWQAWQSLNENLTRMTNWLGGTNLSAFRILTTNQPAAGNALRWDGTNFYWAP